MTTVFSALGLKQPPSGVPASPTSSPAASPPNTPGDATNPAPTPAAASGSSPGLFSNLGDNPLFTGGLAIAALTTGFQVLRKSTVRASALLRRQLLVTVEIPSSDPSYEWFLHFLAEHQRAQAASQLAPKHPPLYTLSGLFSRIKPAPRELAVETRTTKTSTGATKTTFLLVPGQGRHIVNYDNAFFQISRQRDSKRINLPSGTPFETLEITTLYSQRHILTHLLQASQRLASQRVQNKTTVYNSWGTEWRPFGNPQPKRPLSSVILADGVKAHLMNDLHSFLASAAWYRERGIPYRRGYLLYGPPGTGKTSLVKAIAGELEHDICIINLSERGLTDDRLNHLLTHLPERSIALLEDVDAAFNNRRQAAEDGYAGANVTFSGLLNALDGAASGEDRIVVLTTNHPERLDEALLRPGRVDLKVEIGYATKEVVRGMWERFYEPTQENEALRERMVALLEEGGCFEEKGTGVSTAELQGLFLFFKEDPKGAVQAAEGIVMGMKERVRRAAEREKA